MPTPLELQRSQPRDITAAQLGIDRVEVRAKPYNFLAKVIVVLTVRTFRSTECDGSGHDEDTKAAETCCTNKIRMHGTSG
jgi:hypothetical protein